MYRAPSLSQFLQIRRRLVDPRLRPSEEFYYYSIPAYDCGKQPEINTGDQIDSVKFFVDHGDILVSKINPRIKRVWLIDNDGSLRGISSTEFVTVVAIKQTEGKFLFYLMNSDAVYRELLRTAEGTTNSHVRFKPAFLGTIQLDSLPARPSWERIAEILATVDRTIEQTEALIAKTQKIKAGLMHDLFTRGIAKDGKLRPPHEEAPMLYKESPFGCIPKDWDVSTVDECLFGIDAGHSPECPDTPAKADQWGVLKVGAINPSGFRENENKVVQDRRLHNLSLLVRPGDLLFSRANTYDLVGLVCHVETTPCNLMLSDKTLRLRTNSSIVLDRFLFWSLQLRTVRRQIENSASGTSGSMKNISQKNVRALQFGRPNPNEQCRLVAFMDAAAADVKKQYNDLKKLKMLKSGLMHDLLTNQVSVPLPEAEKVETNV